MNRRNFIKRFSLSVGAITLVPQVVIKSITEKQNPVQVFKTLNYERVSALIRKHYIPAVRNFWNMESVLLKMLKEDSLLSIDNNKKIITSLKYNDSD